MGCDWFVDKWSLGALALAAAGVAMAQQGPSEAPKIGAPASERLQAAVEDDRGDSVAPAAPEAGEASSTRSRFDFLDSNHDGMLSAEEFLAVEKAKWARYAKGTAMSLADCSQSYVDGLPAGIDRNLIDAKKFAATVQGLCGARDKNGDGSLTWEEFAGQAWRSFKRMDSSNAGSITYEQFATRGVGATRGIKKPPIPSPALQAQIDKKIAASTSMVKAPRTSEQLAASYAAAIKSGEKPEPLSADQAALRQRRLSGGALAMPKPSATLGQAKPAPVAATATATAPGVAAAAQGAQPKAEPEGIVERVQSWFR